MAMRKIEVRPRLERSLTVGARFLIEQQGEDGAFDLGFDGGALPDSHFVFVSRVIGLDDGDVTRRLARRLLDRQLPEGGWSLAPGLPGHVATSVDAYVALRAAGLGADELALKRARRFIVNGGGLESVRGPTRVTLALLGLSSWSDLAIPPPELALLPARAPFSLFRVGAMLRLHLLPLLVLRGLETVVDIDLSRSLAAELAAPPPAPPLAGRSAYRGSDSVEACVRLMTERLDQDGSLGGLLMATGWAALAAKALGLPEDHPLRRRTAEGLGSFLYRDPGRKIHVRVCVPTVRSSAAALSALRAAGVDDEAVSKARDALLESRAGPRGDFELLGPRGPATAWSIKPRSERFPSLVDTVAVLGALDGLEGCEALVEDAWRWVAAMQRPDGGFALFDRDASSAGWLDKIPLGLLTHTLNDASSPEVTGRVLALSRRDGPLGSRAIEKACSFLERRQRPDGAFQGPFTTGLLSATAAAVAGLAACGRPRSAVADRAVGFLLGAQRPDGGWGESPTTAGTGQYVDLGRSVPSHTGIALAGLLASGSPAAMAGAHRAAEFLAWSQEPNGSWAEEDPTSAGLPDVVYLRDPVDRVARPLAALAAYVEALDDR